MEYALKTLKARMPNFGEIVDGIDSYLVTATTATVKFLDTHPGISMVLSPGTVLRRTAQKHVDNIINKQ